MTCECGEFIIARAEDIEPAFAALKGSAEALYVCTDPLISTHRIRINTLAAAARLPTMHSVREYVEAGGLMSYGASYPELFRRAADLDIDLTRTSARISCCSSEAGFSPYQSGLLSR
jgi:ABC-type uncharacterized transport system substrate-binding protein